MAHTDADGNITTFQFDHDDRLKAELHPLSSVSYTYDQTGNRITETNGAGETTRFFYDARGNVVMTRLPMGGADVNTRYYTTASYDHFGRKLREGNGNGDFQNWTYDYFGNAQSHVDLGGGTTVYSRNLLGQAVTQTRAGGVNAGQSLRYEYYDNGALKRVLDDALHTETLYEYDVAGRQSRERFKSLTTDEIYQDVRLSYDELGRVSRIKDNRYDAVYTYDAVGNRREIRTNYFYPNGASVISGTIDHWYDYDSMNRVLVAQGVLQNGQITISNLRKSYPVLAGVPYELDQGQGIKISYDAAGNRRTIEYFEKDPSSSAMLRTFEGYLFDAENRLTNTYKYVNVNDQRATSARLYDFAGRVKEYTSFSSPNVMKDRQVYAYNPNGWLATQDNYDNTNRHIAQVRYDYSDSYDAVGNVLHYTVDGLVDTTYTFDYRKTYAKLDAYRETGVHGTMTVRYPSGTTSSTGDTTSTYDANGNLIKVDDRLGTNKVRDFVVNPHGQIVQKREGGHTTFYYYANGEPAGSLGTQEFDRNGSRVTAIVADFDYNYTPVSPSYPASTPNSYVVNAGDTLQSIALAVYGDSSLWYLIADANGIGTNGDLSLKTGQTLTIPNRVTNIHNDSGTFKVYRPGEIIGDTTPTVPVPDAPPPPQSGGGCGMIGVVIAVVVVVVAAISQQWYLAKSGAEIGTAAYAAAYGESVLVGAAIGNVTGQALKVAFDLQQGFNPWSLVADVFAAGITQGVLGSKESGGFTDLGKWLGVPGRAAVSSVISQGMNIVTGQQQKFDWRSVAAAAVAAPVVEQLGKDIGTAFGRDPKGNLQYPGLTTFTSGIAGGLVKQGINVAMHGGGKINFANIAADAFGNALGQSIVGQMRNSGSSAKPLTFEEVNWHDPADPDTGPNASGATSDGGAAGGDQARTVDPVIRRVTRGGTVGGMSFDQYGTADEDTIIRIQKFTNDRYSDADNGYLPNVHVVQPGQKIAFPDRDILDTIEVTDADRATYRADADQQRANAEARENATRLANGAQQGADRGEISESDPVNSGRGSLMFKDPAPLLTRFGLSDIEPPLGPDMKEPPSLWEGIKSAAAGWWNGGLSASDAARISIGLVRYNYLPAIDVTQDADMFAAKFLIGEFGALHPTVAGAKLGVDINFGRAEFPLIGNDPVTLSQGGTIGMEIPLINWKKGPDIGWGMVREREVMGGWDGVTALPGDIVSQKAFNYLKDIDFEPELELGRLRSKERDLVFGFEIGFGMGVYVEANASEAVRRGASILNDALSRRQAEVRERAFRVLPD